MQLILVINCRTRIEYYANKFSTLILGLIVRGLCFLGVNVFAIECIEDITFERDANRWGALPRSRKVAENCSLVMFNISTLDLGTPLTPTNI